ncbi:MAG: NADH-quinone oxidoreductase subunit J [Phycisphaerales bacterium]|nr:NADH-quinone oxidoreductase subunit J [Phycisphaerales bacterium]MCB9856161.1 NADH-quinone oxidoreductase subunit J [Phycisphaerales bacterium]
MIEDAAFYIFAGVSLFSAIAVVLSKNIVRAAVGLLGTLGGVACLYFLADANLLGVIQLIVYAGGTLILIVFGIMLTSQSPWVGFLPTKVQAIAASIVAVILTIGIVRLVTLVPWAQRNPDELSQSLTVKSIGDALLTTYLVPFEVASVLLLVVMIGAAYLARTEK